MQTNFNISPMRGRGRTSGKRKREYLPAPVPKVVIPCRSEASASRPRKWREPSWYDYLQAAGLGACFAGGVFAAMVIIAYLLGGVIG